MSHRPLRLVLACSVLFVACVQASPAPEEETRFRIDLQELDVSFAFREQLVLRASEEEALLSGDTTAIQVQTLPYRDSAPAAREGESPTWALPREIANQVLEQRSCGPLKGERTYVPIDTTSPLRCDLVLDPAGRSVVWMVGLGRPFQDAPFLQSMLLVLEEDEYHAFSYVLPFPEADATVQWLAETFDDRHPGMSTLIWPNRSFMLHSQEVQEALLHQIDPPSAEVQDAMEELEKVAFSVDRSRELPQR